LLRNKRKELVMQLENKVALVTGGNSGIGLGTARRLVEEGAFVYITGRRKQALDKAVKELGANARAIQADGTKKADMERVAATIRDEQVSSTLSLPTRAAEGSSRWKRSPKRISTAASTST
jgi:NAD(P)-dependent dehydrogenase (short-subunit alcohol dehydrogenase family)